VILAVTWSLIAVAKSATVLQNGVQLTTCWRYWTGVGRGYCADYASYYFPKADVVPAGTRLHVRIAKPERPSSLRIDAYPRVENVDPDHPEWGKYVEGQRQPLGHTFRRVDRDGKTVAWDVFFRVNEPSRHYSGAHKG
jgi:hypothetical protein